MSIYDAIAGPESSFGKNVWGPVTSSGQAQGTYQITTGTWAQFAPAAGISTVQYPTPNSAPLDVQTQVASAIPLNRWAPSTVAAVQSQYPGIDTSQTVGTLAQQTSGSAIASGPSTVTGTGGAVPAAGAFDGSGLSEIGATEAPLPSQSAMPAAGTGFTVNLGIQQTLSTWLGSVTTWIADGFRSGFGILSNLFTRGMLIVLGIVILLVALWRLMDPDFSTAKSIATEAAA